MGRVVTLAAQVGGAKLAEGLYRLRGKDLTVVVNTGDDFEHLNLSFCPDLDTVLYMLAGIAAQQSGWEPQGETRAVQRMVSALGGPDRPALGDRSLAAPLLRSEGLARGRTLTQITLDFCRRLGIEAQVLPMCDEAIRTYVLTADGAVAFPDYFNELACEPPARGFQYAGADEARLSEEVLDALHAADLEAVIIGPANPYHAIRPMLEIPGMREMLRQRRAPVIAVSPIIGARALRGSAGKMMRELGREPTARGIAVEYLRLIDGFVIDREDASLAESIASLGMRVLAAPALMRTNEDRVVLARAVLDFAAAIREARAEEVQ
jgi:LPPG:FO 2-phospho-L-lactate transferase